MEKRGRRGSKRLRKLIIVCTLCAIILTVSTYAWFIGLRSVKVTSFDVEIATADSLMLSLNGSRWANEIVISKENLNEVSYAGHTNSWGGVGLIPMSTIGEMDHDASRMKLYEKASMTPTKGGYRLMASRINNNGAGETEKPGYVVFDLFVRNFTGTQYLPELDLNDEEAIYLTTDSRVTVASDGVANTGIENSVRVAFTQIGRVAGTVTDATTITGITCADTNTGGENATPVVTGICRDAQIWEPNDINHVQDAIDYYQESCLKRTAAGVTPESYQTEGADKNCLEVVDGTSYDTYAVKTAITHANGVDVYDGADYNTYTGSGDYLYAYPYFTDTMRDMTGTSRPQFMMLAPNSITKLRIYIYIEGQDVDNYDYAAIGKKISITFGFTKERFTTEDIGYTGPYLPTDLGVCFGSTAPTTVDTCDTAFGSWHLAEGETPAYCSGDTKQYCDATNGTFAHKGTCAGGEAPTSQEACTNAHGTWSGEACSGNNELYCTTINGVFTATGFCDDITAPATDAAKCTTAEGTWIPGAEEGTGTCSGNTRAYCAAVKGTFKPGLE